MILTAATVGNGPSYSWRCPKRDRSITTAQWAAKFFALSAHGHLQRLACLLAAQVGRKQETRALFDSARCSKLPKLPTVCLRRSILWIAFSFPVSWRLSL